ncbi:MAG: hypothetical protein JXA30_09095 [Deltaproteobacteria bacterium]|nr:hypothetical protein [Deltaproteobacteria bacterium]
MFYKTSIKTQNQNRPNDTLSLFYCVLLVAAFYSLIVGCDSEESTRDDFLTGTGGQTVTQLTGGTQPQTGAGIPAGGQGGASVQDASPTSDGAGPQATSDASTTVETRDAAKPQTEAGGQADSQTQTLDGGVDVAPVGDSAPGDSAVGDSAIDTGPVDYGARGPYEVVVEKNVGEAFRNNVSDDTAMCQAFMAMMNSDDPAIVEELTTYPPDMDRQLYTLFRPAELQAGKKYPAITWGNGTCSHPLLFVELLEHLASHGFIIIATNWRWVASGVEMLRGIDFILSENENQSSALFGKIDTKMLGACGHSQGSMATVVVGADERIVATVPIQGANAASVAALNGPTFLIAGELDDIVNPAGVEAAFGAARVPAVFGLSMGNDHLMPGLDPSPILEGVTGWFKIHLENDQKARDLFYGDACKLCSDPKWQIQRKNM